MRIINYILLGFLFLGALACQEDRHDVEGRGKNPFEPDRPGIH